MRDRERWRPTKFQVQGGRLRASRDPREVGVSSRLAADAVAALYQEHLPRYASGRLADLGCGKVPLFETYATFTREVICVDWPDSLHPSPHLDVLADLGCPLPFANACFDTVLLSDVLEHLPRPEQAVAELARVLVPGGRLLLNVPFLYPIHEEPHDYHRFTEYALRRLVERSGLRLLRLEAIGGGAEVIADLLAKHLAQLPRVGTVLARLVQGCAALLGRTRFGRRLAAHSARNYPWGYFLVAEKPAAPPA